MKQISPFSHTLYVKLYAFALSVLLAYCLFNAIHSVIILLPIFAHDILHLGIEGLGILRAAPAIGACIMMLLFTCYSLM